MNRLIILAGFALLLAGCQSEEPSFKDAPQSNVPGPGKDAMDKWANENKDNGKPGHDEGAAAPK